MTEFKSITTELSDNILTLTMNRPEKLNAYDFDMQKEMVETFRRVNDDDEVRAVIVTGEGRGFCSGMDLGGRDETFNTSVRPSLDPLRVDGRWRDGGGRLTLAIFDCLKPVIAAVNGPAVGIGATMTLAMDIRLASTAASYGFVFARRGLANEAASSWFLPRVVGIEQALKWLYSGRIFPAQEAFDKGLASELLAPDELIPRAREIAREIVENTSAISIAVIRQMMWKIQGADHPMEAHKLDSRGIETMGKSADAREGVTAFLEKRKPQFTMKVSEDMPGWYPWWDEPRFR